MSPVVGGEEGVRMVDLSGRRVVVTGGASGIGATLAEQVAAAGGEVVIASRDTKRGRATAAAINERQGGRPGVEHLSLDLADVDSVHSFVKSLEGRPVDVLVGNAGVMNRGQLRRTREGLEWHFGVNYFGHFLLAELLAPGMCARGGRVVQLSSGSHRLFPVDLDDPQFRITPYDPDLAYARSKSACALLAVGLQQAYGEQGLLALAVSPGVVRTPLLDGLSGAEVEQMFARLVDLVRTPEQAAASILFAATSPTLAGQGGSYVEDGALARPATEDRPGGVADHARDPTAAARLRELSLDLRRSMTRH